MKPSSTLYVTDLDGTLLGADSRVSARSRDILNQLAERGVMITPATARTPATVQLLMEGVTQPTYIDAEGKVCALPSIVMTGGALWNRKTVQFETCRLIPQDDVVHILQAFERAAIKPFVYCMNGNKYLDVYHPSAMTSRENAFYQERSNLQLKRFHLDCTPPQCDNVALFFAIGPVKIVEAVVAELKNATNCAAAWYPDTTLADTGLIDLYAPGVSKAHAVKELAQKVQAERVVVFGDNLNDLPMMRVADVAIATENALPQVKAEADVVIGLNSDDAVAEYILRCES